MLVRAQAVSEKAREPGYPWVLQTKKCLQHPKVLLPAQLLIVTPLLKAEEPLQGWKAARCLQLSCCHSCLIALPLITEQGMVKSQKQIQQCSYPHLSGRHSLLTTCLKVMWVSALHWCVVGVPSLGTQCVTAWQWDPMPSKKKAGTRRRLFIGQCHS